MWSLDDGSDAITWSEGVHEIIGVEKEGFDPRRVESFGWWLVTTSSSSNWTPPSRSTASARR